MQGKTGYSRGMKKKSTTYGQLLARLLEHSGLSAYRLGKRAGVTSAGISLILNEKRKPNVDTLERLLRAAGVTWGWLDENLSAADLPDGE